MLIIVYILCIASWIAGGQKGKLRDIPFPLFIGIGIVLKGHYWLALACCATFQIIKLGYGNYEDPQVDPRTSWLASITHDRQGAVIRLIYGLLVASAGALPLALGHCLALWLYFLYIAGNSLVGSLCSRLRFNVFLTDALVGGGFAVIIFLTK